MDQDPTEDTAVAYLRAVPMTWFPGPAVDGCDQFPGKNTFLNFNIFPSKQIMQVSVPYLHQLFGSMYLSLKYLRRPIESFMSFVNKKDLQRFERHPSASEVLPNNE